MITARNTNDMMYRAYDYICSHGVYTESRNGPVLSIPHPITLCYTHPLEKINFCPIRDANPFFHAIEPLWFLEARGDVSFISEFLPRMVEYSDDGTSFNGHYGCRVRKAFGRDQLLVVIEHLTKHPDSRRAVVQLWRPSDLDKDSKDLPCNMSFVFRIINHTLNMTVYNRSNDAIWGGISGANITNLPIFQEYVAVGLGLPVGKLYVVSNNLHLYMDNPQTKKMLDQYSGNIEPSVVNQMVIDPYKYLITTPIITDYRTFDMELKRFMDDVRAQFFNKRKYTNKYFENTMKPMVLAFWQHKAGRPPGALAHAKNIAGADWQLACNNWLTRRYTK